MSDPASISVKRKFRRRLIWLACLGVIVTACYQWADPDRAFRTADRFETLVRQHRFDDAMAMMPPEDRRKIPASYWRQFEGHEFMTLSNPTPITWFSQRMQVVFAFSESDGTGGSDSGIRFEVNGNSILVFEVNRAYLESLSAN